VKRILLVTWLFSPPAWSLSAEAQEFIAITKQLEPVQCEKRKLRRELALAELEPRLAKSSDPEDLAAISRQSREAFYRCD
jgi:hypothetical protein